MLKYEETMIDLIEMLYYELITLDDAYRIDDNVMKRLHNGEGSVYWDRILGLTNIEASLYGMGLGFDDLVVYRYKGCVPDETLSSFPVDLRKYVERLMES
ncbi:MAG: hypothetical protein GY753_02875 [Gammaproteobacteria bacterium]|nr:hypothetical protein [Gammaproteobacteria bacterium]